MTLLNTFYQEVHASEIIAPGSSVLLAISGGIDSMALLDLMYLSREKLNLRLAVAHVNHTLRSEALSDELFVANQAKIRGLPFFSSQINVPEKAKQTHTSIETAARHARYMYLNKLCQSIGFDSIATAHQAEDQAETIVMNLIRGTGIRGLRGIRSRYQNIVRPLLFASKQMLLHYLTTRQIPYVYDFSNQNVVFLRNKIRHDYLKSLQSDFGQDVVYRINRAGYALSEIEVYLNYETDRALRRCVRSETSDEIVLDIYQFLHYFTAIQKGILFRLIDQFLDYQKRIQTTDIQHILELANSGKSGSRFDLSHEISVYKTTRTLAFVKTKPRRKRIQVKLNGITKCHAWGIQIKTVVTEPKGEPVFSSSRFIETVDFDAIQGALFLRQFNHGDAFIPLGMKGRKKLHDFFIDSGVPVYQRENIPVLTDEKSIVWVIGHRIDERYRLRKNTRYVLQFEVSKIS